MRITVGKKKHVVLIDDADWELIKDWRLTVSTKDKYATISRQRNNILESRALHRFLMNAKRGEIVDHIDGNRLNNSRANLRIGSHIENSMNMGISVRSSTGVTGVSWAPSHQRFIAYISSRRKKIHLGRFKSLEAAVDARRKAEIKYHGEFSRRAPQQVELPLEDSDLFFGPEVVQASLFGGEDD